VVTILKLKSGTVIRGTEGGNEAFLALGEMWGGAGETKKPIPKPRVKTGEVVQQTQALSLSQLEPPGKKSDGVLSKQEFGRIKQIIKEELDD